MKLRFSWGVLAGHAGLLAFIGFMQSMTHLWTDHRADLPTLDHAVGSIALLALPAFALLYGGDRLARTQGWSKQPAYCAIGAIAGLTVQALAVGPHAYRIAAVQGTVVLTILIQALIGTLDGFLVRKELGYSTDGDDPAALEKATAAPPEPLAPGQFGQKGRIDTADATYYDGPLQVRSSAAAAAIAAIVAAMLYATLGFFSPAMQDLAREGMTPPVFRDNPVLALVFGGAAWSIPFYFFTRRAHAFLQRRAKPDLSSYLKAGAIVPIVLTLPMMLMLGGLALLVTLQFMVPSVVAMGMYHRLAGLEPLDLPDDIEVRDQRTLLPADHVRRSARRVIVQ